MLREQLRQREQDRERQKRTWEMAERAADERREAERQQLLRQEEELSTRMRQQDDELRRRQQENTLFVQVLFIQLVRSQPTWEACWTTMHAWELGYLDNYLDKSFVIGNAKHRTNLHL